ncbi:MAG: nitrate reductase molybdenum cofactor assembly chaperone [Candidatus Azosocius agrarius]|nr:MAG: nitrate reductase molybdenum cofactor assembly chaperone [Gammaproteobacteria bacterium]
MVNTSIIYKILSILLMYPDNNLKFSLKDLLYAFDNEKILSINSHDEIVFFMNFLMKEDLLLLQQLYVDTFDRKKLYSLYLFEHIHGDSKDRGQAMVDLQNMYISNGYKISSYELPDYLPVFLEYLSLISQKEAGYFLGEIINIVMIIGNRLKNVNNIYYKLFFALEELSVTKVDENIIKLALSYEEKMNFGEEFEYNSDELTFQNNRKISNNY